MCSDKTQKASIYGPDFKYVWLKKSTKKTSGGPDGDGVVASPIRYVFSIDI